MAAGRAPTTELDLAPMADGGEGTMAALVDALHGEVVRGHGDRARAATPWRPSSGSRTAADGRLAIVEMASASGLGAALSLAPRPAPDHDPRDRRADRSRRSTAQPTRLLVGSGGSATNDGGAGMAQALGCALAR